MLSRLKTNFDVSSRKCKEEQEREDKEKWKSLDVVVSSCPAGLGPITQNYINYNYIKFFISITITVIIFQINYNYTVSITITITYAEPNIYIQHLLIMYFCTFC